MSMGNAASVSLQPPSTAQKIRDGAEVDHVSPEGKAFAHAIKRMHHIFRDCDDEFRALSGAANEHGRKSEECKAAALRLQACQERRTREFTLIEKRCGPAQEAYRLCVEQTRGTSADAEFKCLPVLHSFIDCADRALQSQGQAP